MWKLEILISVFKFVLLSKTTFSGNQEILQLTQSLENMRNEYTNKSETLISKQNEIVNKKFILDTNDPVIEYNELNQIYEDVLEYNNKLKDNFEKRSCFMNSTFLISLEIISCII